MFKKTTKIILTFTLLVGAIFASVDSFGNRVDAATPTFSDIKGHWAEKNIIEATNHGLVKGFPDGTFRPDDVVTGDQFVTLMLKAFSDGGTKFDQPWLDSLTYEYPTKLSDIRAALGSSGFMFQNAKTGYWAKPFLDMLYDMRFLTTFDPVFPQTKTYDAFSKQITREKASYLLGKWIATYEDSYDPAYSDYVVAHSGMVDINDFSNSAVRNYRSTSLDFGRNKWIEQPFLS